ncbi:WD40 repeat domain-containing protein [Stieleria sp. TO1_6]|uniref:WD40 repeat domain-containing protein n=1 Tax=Stieleria tagensis TaxID=2956795 RepID=UPI00209A8CA7|nr:WD40 repeat domain-containing protein [Stieleria tagensis]MCO8122519.1 WD40 repeat domain-containing protein [Stieleria tagensis]
MSPRQIDQYERLFMSRRRVLLSTLVGGATLVTSQVAVGDPAGNDQVVARVAAENLDRPIPNEIVRLPAISKEFEQTIVQAIASDPLGKLIAVAGDDHAIRVIDATSLEMVATLQGHSDLIQTLQFDSNGDRLVSAGNDGQLILWDRKDQFRQIQRMAGTPALACVRFSPDGHQLAAVGFKNQVFLIGRSPGQGSPKVECDCTDLRAVDYRSDGKVLAVAGRNGDLNLFDRASNESLGAFKIHSGRVHALQFHTASNVVVSVGEDGRVTIFDTAARVIVSQMRVTSGKLFSVAILDQDHLAVAGSDNVIRIVDVTSGQIVKELSGHTGSIAALACTGTQLFSGGYDATLRRWQLSSIQGVRDRIAERDQSLDR